MEVRIAVFAPINYIVRNPDSSRAEIGSYFRTFIDKVRQSQAEYNNSLNGVSPNADINLLVEPSCIVAWSSNASESGKTIFMKFCKGVMVNALNNRIALRGYVDHKLVDGKTWHSPDFYYERYSLEWSPEVTKAMEQLKSTPWCGVQYTKDAAADTTRDYFVTDERHITMPMNKSLVIYSFPNHTENIIGLRWLEPIAYPDCMVKDMFSPNFNPEPENEILDVIKNTEHFLAYARQVSSNLKLTRLQPLWHR